MISFEYAKSYCNDDISLIENYDKAVNDKDNIWDCHHRRENISSRKELKELGEYYSRPASELIFLTHSEHSALHAKGKHISDETKRKLSLANKGAHHTEETKRKMSIANKGAHHTEETKQKISIARKGLHWFNNGIITVLAKSCPEGFVKGRINLKKYEKRQ